jgi:archaellum component FlaF (FlaF/FlaG flagellin family)
LKKAQEVEELSRENANSLYLQGEQLRNINITSENLNVKIKVNFIYNYRALKNKQVLFKFSYLDHLTKLNQNYLLPVLSIFYSSPTKTNTPSTKIISKLADNCPLDSTGKPILQVTLC